MNTTTKTMEVTFKIKDKNAKEKIIKIRNTHINFTKLFIGWVMDYEIPKQEVFKGMKKAALCRLIEFDLV